MLKRKHLEKRCFFLLGNPHVSVFICHISKEKNGKGHVRQERYYEREARVINFNLVPSRYGEVSKKRRILMKKQKQIRSNWIFCICAAITASAGWLGLVNTNPVLAAESVGEEMVVNDVAAGAGVDTAGELSENSWGGVVSKSGNTAGDENLGVYDFKDNKTTGTVTVTKVWDDDKTNEERAIPDIKISTNKPSKNPLGYTVTFHGNKDAGLVFDDGSEVNEVVYNSSGQIVGGVFKMPVGWAANTVAWFTDSALANKVDVSEDGAVQMDLSGDIDLWGKVKTFEIKVHETMTNGFNKLIPNTVMEIFFTDETKPEIASVIDVDADGDGGVVAWTENNDTVMKVSTQIKGVKIQAAKDSSNMFYEKSNIKNINFENFNTSNATNMGYMFAGCSSLLELDLQSFDTQKAYTMRSMFRKCTNLKVINISQFDTSNVQNMTGMFYQCNSVESLDLSSFKFEKLTNISDAGTLKFYVGGDSNINYNSYDGPMFAGCKALKILKLPQDNKIRVKKLSALFDTCSNLSYIDLNAFDMSLVEDISGMFIRCDNLISVDLKNIDMQNVQNASCLFGLCKNIKEITLPEMNSMLDISGGFFGCNNLETLRLPKINNLINTSGLFYGCKNLNTLNSNLSQINTSNITDMSYMFARSSFVDDDIFLLNTGNVLNFMYMFSGCNITSNINLSILKTEKATNIKGMFAGCNNITTINLSVLDTTNVTDMSSLFMNCESVTNIDMSTLNTKMVTNMNYMFFNCGKLSKLDLSNFNTENVTDMREMFAQCGSLSKMDLSSFDTSNVKTMKEMFQYCRSLLTIDISNFNTCNVTDMSGMFYGCRSIENLELEFFDTSNVDSMSGMFAHCLKIKNINLTSFNTQNVTNMKSMFLSCSNLTSVTTGPNFKFVGTNYNLSGTWQNTAGETFNGNNYTANFPSNIAATYTKIK